MNKKGFTLIEVLVTILLLAVIALIIIPTINGIMTKSRIGAAKASAISYLSSLEKTIMNKNLEEKYSVQSGKNYYFSSTSNYIEQLNVENLVLDTKPTIKGFIPTDGYVVFSAKYGTISYSKIIINGYEFECITGKCEFLGYEKPYTPVTPTVVASSFPTMFDDGIGRYKMNFDPSYKVTNYYSIDSGTTWKLYGGTVVADVASIKVKSISKDNVESPIVTVNSVLATGYMPIAGYDGTTSTYVNFPRTSNCGNSSSASKYLDVDSSMWGKNFKMTYLAQDNSSGEGYFNVVYQNSVGGTISSWKSRSNSAVTVTLTVPDNTTRIRFYYNNSSGACDYISRLYEVSPDNTPKLTAEKVYPLVTLTGISAPGYKMTSKYFSTAVSKLYSIDSGVTWNDYTENYIIPNGTVYSAKSLDSFGVSSSVASYTASVSTSDMVVPLAYDGNTSTYQDFPRIADCGAGSSNIKYMNVDPSIWNKNVKITYIATDNSSGEGYFYMLFLDSAGTTLSTFKNRSNSVVTVNVNVPENTSKIKMYYYNSSGACGYVSRLYEITPDDTPKFVANKVYPVVSEIGITNAGFDLQINYYATATQKLYSIDNAVTWLDYTSNLFLLDGVNLKAKSKNVSLVDSSIGTYSSNVSATDMLQTQAYDGNNSTYVGFPRTNNCNSSSSVSRYLNVDSTAWGKTLNFRYIAQDNSSGEGYFNIVFLNSSGAEISRYANRTNSVINASTTIPSDTAKIKIYYSNSSGACDYVCNLYELSIS